MYKLTEQARDELGREWLGVWLKLFRQFVREVPGYARSEGAHCKPGWASPRRPSEGRRTCFLAKRKAAIDMPQQAANASTWAA